LSLQQQQQQQLHRLLLNLRNPPSLMLADTGLSDGDNQFCHCFSEKETIYKVSRKWVATHASRVKNWMQFSRQKRNAIDMYFLLETVEKREKILTMKYLEEIV
jgi:hypothetical protein